MTNVKDRGIENRREALGKFGVVAGAMIWSKPLVELVVLPVHAMTTNDLASSGGTADDADDDTGNSGGGGSNGGGGGGGDPCSQSDCGDSATFYRIKAEWDGNSETDGAYTWENPPGDGNGNDCIPTGSNTPADGGNFGSLSGNALSVTFTLTSSSCKIIQASHKAGSCNQGQCCFPGSISGVCQNSVTFNSQAHGISHIELIIACCPGSS